MTRPNILYLHSHDTGRYVQPYGHAIPTPAIQRLAEEGLLFRQAFCAAPTCSASRAALLTGQSAHSAGMTGLAHRGWDLADYRTHIVHTLRRAGYTSTLLGIQHVARDAERIGYDNVVGPHGASADERREGTVRVAERFFSDPPPQPFFVDVGFHETHREFLPPAEAEDPRYCLPPAPLPGTPEVRADMASFKASARALDAAYERILRAIDRNGARDRTLVVCTTDHGIAFPGMKCSLTDHGIGVLLIMRGPGGFEGGRITDAMVSQIDLFPTLCELLDINPPEWLEGRSMIPVVRGETGEVNEAIFAEVSYHAAYEPQRAVRTKRWKYIRRYGDRDTPVLPNCDDSASKDVWLRAGWRDQPVAREQLCDLAFDPCEVANRVADPAAAGALTELRARLDRWMLDTNDPLLRGPVAAPVGARVNDANGLSPGEPAHPASTASTH